MHTVKLISFLMNVILVKSNIKNILLEILSVNRVLLLEEVAVVMWSLFSIQAHHQTIIQGYWLFLFRKYIFQLCFQHKNTFWSANNNICKGLELLYYWKCACWIQIQGIISSKLYNKMAKVKTVPLNRDALVFCCVSVGQCIIIWIINV